MQVAPRRCFGESGAFSRKETSQCIPQLSCDHHNWWVFRKSVIGYIWTANARRLVKGGAGLEEFSKKKQKPREELNERARVTGKPHPCALGQCYFRGSK